MACHKIQADFNCDNCQQNFDSLDQFIRHCREIHGNMECTESGDQLALLMEGKDHLFPLFTVLPKTGSCQTSFHVYNAIKIS